MNRLHVEEAEVSVPNPIVLGEQTLIFTLEDVLQLGQADRACGRREHSASAVTVVTDGELHAEKLRVSVVAFLLVDGVAIAVLVRVDDVLSEHAEQDSHQLVDVVNNLPVLCTESSKDLHGGRGHAKFFLGNSGRLEESVDEVPRQPKDALADLVFFAAGTANSSSHLEVKQTRFSFLF